MAAFYISTFYSAKSHSIILICRSIVYLIIEAALFMPLLYYHLKNNWVYLLSLEITFISTLLFIDLPSGVSFVAFGFALPYPTTFKVLLLTPLLTR